MTDLLLYNGNPSAVPAFRIIAIVEGDIHAEPSRSALAAIYSRFEAAFGESANVTAYNFPGHTGKIRWTNPDLITDGQNFFRRDSTEYGEGIRRYGYAIEEFKEPAVPYFCVEQRSHFHFLEIDLPETAPSIREFADFVTEELLKVRVITGVMGFGFFLPPYKGSLEFILGAAAARFKAAIEISPSMVMDGVRREGSAYRWKSGEKAGIADIGWRTLVGAEFWDRLPPMEDIGSQPDIAVDKSDTVLSITAGSEPIWGDVNKGEAIDAYRAVAAYLSPVQMPAGCMKAFAFGGTGEPAHNDKVEAYLSRFE
ncbi:DUF3396 domain-containing protein [Rhizobiales bacterium RZME27]|uniref:DUF3396 domain-containing protein n=1 Tax=Endobacterium cereale TaxID=2663029 RepID=A0A6A8AB94_9HYPH|nr:DUF3396 domain-containing protein [Endobacterium cereale]MEB2848204.1 DUF3396 domain-containing protein [Endobacterium cereale]MQY46071.1 DUF3396 domain-containing protein [Endobacterium cereale]